ncbi:putative U-box domain-containing protein 25 [Iris pallida]|uniref:U-box domain-containing protein n=1 Tax=Iris pallida TaxID=29817 RepID=A0AAX6FLR9_IRIPA|nr:putative U-box domain-containing protein 25 [Iris pallida]
MPPASVSVSPLDLSGVQIPHHFRCPISLELMRDPVTVATGQTYDRVSIESWAAAGHTTCPVTRCPLPPDFPLSLIPNHTLRRLIQDWCVSHRSLGVDRIPTPKQPPSPSTLRLLLSRADLPSLRKLRSLAKDSDKNRSLMSTPETRASLIHLSFLDPHSAVSAEAIAVLSLLPLAEQDALSIVQSLDRLSYLADLIGSYATPADLRASAGALLESATSLTRSTEARSAIGSAHGVIQGMVSLIDTADGRSVRIGIRGLFALCLAKENRTRAVAAGAAGVVMRKLQEMTEPEVLVRALAAVELLCRTEEGREAVAGVERAAGILVRAMAVGKERAAEHAAGALVSVVGDSEERQAEAVEAGVVTQLLLMVQGGCSDRAKRKAQLLLKMLRPAWAHYETMVNSDDYYYFQPF